MDYSTILLEIREDALILTINRPEALNALNGRVMDELEHFFREGFRQYDFKGIVIQGAGEKSFVAGADISEFLSLDEKGAAEMSRKGQAVFFAIERFPKPVIAAVQGFALGGGCELAMACHIRLATAKAKFGQPEVNLGTIPGYGGTQRLIQYIGKGKALELMLTGDILSAADALRLGLVNHIHEPEELLDKAVSMIGKIGQKGPVAVSEVIHCVNTYFESGVNGFTREAQSFGFAGGTADFKEGATAFLEKRKPAFKGV